MRRTDVTGVPFKDPNRMNWESYKHELRVEAVPCKNCLGHGVEIAIDLLLYDILQSYNQKPSQNTKVTNS
jgi:deoxycytidylate deaminase